MYLSKQYFTTGNSKPGIPWFALLRFREEDTWRTDTQANLALSGAIDANLFAILDDVVRRQDLLRHTIIARIGIKLNHTRIVLTSGRVHVW